MTFTLQNSANSSSRHWRAPASNSHLLKYARKEKQVLMVTGMASFAISIQRVCKKALLGSHWFSESLRYMCVSEMEPDRESECAAGKPGTDLTKSARSAPTLVFALFIHNS